MSDIFISYAREDRAKAEAIARLFQEQGWSVWWDREMVPGASFDQVIEKELAAAKCVVVLWSKQSVGANWVKAEASEGVTRGVLVPIMIEQTNLPLEFRRLHTADVSGWNDGDQHPEMDAVLKAVATQIKAPLRSLPQKPRARLSRTMILCLVGAASLLALGLYAKFHQAPVSSSDHKQLESTGTELVRTQNLGLEFWQQNQERPMFSEAHYNSIVRVKMKREPFEIRSPKTKAVLQICAWTDDSIFAQIDQGKSVGDIFYFAEGHGMADTASGSAQLFLTNEANHYFDEGRRRPISAQQDSIFISKIRNDQGPVLDWPTLYLVVFIDENENGVVDNGEFDRIVLEFEK